MKHTVLKIITRGSLLGGLVPFAASAGPAILTAPNVTDIGQLLQTVCNVVNIMFTGLLLLAIIFVIAAAYRYLTAGGDPEVVKKANYQLLYAGIAIVVAVIARGAPYVVAQTVTQGSAFTGC
jgi:hypothetical protein